MCICLRDWPEIKELIKRRMFHADMRYRGMSYEQAIPYLSAELNKLTVSDLETFLTNTGAMELSK